VTKFIAGGFDLFVLGALLIDLIFMKDSDNELLVLFFQPMRRIAENTREPCEY
jgi:hypothetical protein